MWQKIKKLFKPSWKTLRKKVIIREQERIRHIEETKSVGKFLSFGAKVIILAIDHFSDQEENKKSG